VVLKRVRVPVVSLAVVSFGLGVLSATAIAGWGSSPGDCAQGSNCAALVDVQSDDAGGDAVDDTPGAAATEPSASATPMPEPTTPPVVTLDPPGQPDRSRAAVAGASGTGGTAPEASPGAAAPAHDHSVAAQPPAPASGGGCVSNCGEPRYFCDTWAGGFCDDYRNKASGATHVAFPAPGDPYSFDAFSTTYPDWQTEGPAPADGLRGFSANEHFMTVVEDGQFGLGVLRLKQPFDFAGREGHVHFDVDLKTGARRYVRFMLSPELAKVLTDDRQRQNRRPANAFDLWFINGRFSGSVIRGGEEVSNFFPYTEYFGTDDVRDDIDIYVTRTSVRILVNGQVMINEAVPDMGFDRAYVYLVQASYNPCKDGECGEELQMFHWDNVAFDGPVLPINGLTPAGSQDVVFNAYRAASCSVAGAPAEPVGPEPESSRITWRARLPANMAVGPADVACDYTIVKESSDQISGFEIVRP
jgi:hypothetical protein